MKYVVSFEEEAEYEYLEAIAWYEKECAGLGMELLLEVENSLDTLRLNAYFEIRYLDLRLLNVKRFPYQLIYRLTGNEIKIVSFFHGHRDPEIWKKNKNGR